MIEYLIPLLASWLPIWSEYLIFFFALGFLGFCGFLLHLFLWR